MEIDTTCLAAATQNALSDSSQNTTPQTCDNISAGLAKGIIVSSGLAAVGGAIGLIYGITAKKRWWMVLLLMIGGGAIGRGIGWVAESGNIKT